MRKKMIECKTLRTAKRRAPWACKFLRVEGGWIAFESFTDYQVAKGQK